MRFALMIAVALSLAGCSVLGALAREDVLRAMAIFVVVAALAGFLISRMRR